MAATFAWAVLVIVLVLVGSGRVPIHLAAVAGLMVLGFAGVAPLAVVFAGYGHPALVTIVAVFLMTQGVINSGLLLGLGQDVGRRVKTLKAQVLTFAGVGALLSALMNNVGAVGLLIPTGVRMAKRFGAAPGTFGLPLAMGSILGGTLTLIGSSANIIVASVMLQRTGTSFRMFDFLFHGSAMLITASVIWWVCWACGINPGSGESRSGEVDDEDLPPEEELHLAPFASRARQLTLGVLGAAILAVAIADVHPALGFGGAVLILFASGVLETGKALKQVDWKVVLFLGAMLGMGEVLSETGGLDQLAQLLLPMVAGWSPTGLVLGLILTSTLLASGVNNAAAAVFMAPLAAGIAEASDLTVSAALMAVAAGSNMAFLFPTHQAVLIVRSWAPFSISAFMRAGLILTVFCGAAAAAVILMVWQH